MPRPLVLRATVLALLGAFALCAPVSPAAAKAKPCPAKKGKTCKKKPRRAVPKTRITVDLLDGSLATVQIPAIPLPGGQVLTGTPATVTVPIAGQLKGSTPVYLLSRTNSFSLEQAAITLGAVDLLTDPACGGAPTLRLNPASKVVLDPGRQSVATIRADGFTSASVNTRLQLAFDTRQGTACDSPLVATGVATTAFPVSLTGQVQRGTGLSNLALDGDPTGVSAAVCLDPGAPAAPCAGPPAGYPVSIDVSVKVKIAVGGS